MHVETKLRGGSVGLALMRVAAGAHLVRAIAGAYSGYSYGKPPN